MDKSKITFTWDTDTSKIKLNFDNMKEKNEWLNLVKQVFPINRKTIING